MIGKRFPGLWSMAAMMGCFFSAAAAGGAAGEPAWAVEVGPIRPAHFGDDHMSEGVLLPMSDGRVRFVFRLDPGVEGHHVGNGGRLATSVYDPGDDRWGPIQTLYNSDQYDDRNIHGGVTRQGRMVVFFRHYDASKKRTAGLRHLHSEDDGATWSKPAESEQLTGIAGTGQMFYLPGRERYGIMQYGIMQNDFLRGGHSMLLSRDGLRWDARRTVIEASEKRRLNEIAGAWAGQRTIVALLRQAQQKRGHPLMQVVSRDNGETWTEPKPTNIPPNEHWGAAPQLYYDAQRDLLIALNSTRYSKSNDDQHLFIYTARPEQIVDDPKGWTQQAELLRPWARDDLKGDRPLNHTFYGYPTIAPLGEGRFLVVFTERARMGGREQADTYYCRFELVSKQD